MPVDLTVELRCIQNKDGSYNAGAFENGKQVVGDGDFFVHQGDCDAIAAFYRKLRQAYPSVPVQIVGPCSKCNFA